MTWKGHPYKPLWGMSFGERYYFGVADCGGRAGMVLYGGYGKKLRTFIGTAKRLHSLMIRRPPGIYRFINFAIALPRSPLGRASKLI